MSVSNEIRKYVVENVFDEASAEGRRRCSVTSGEIHSAMRLKNRMPTVCSALRSKKLQKMGSVRLLREVRRLGVKLNNSTNRYEFEILDSSSDEGESDSSFKAKHVVQYYGISNQKEDKHGTLVVISCGKAKIWKRSPNAGPTRARGAYIGSPFKVNREYAERFANKWMILSAKYGFIEPDFVIPEDYNVTFDDPTAASISLEHLKEQAQQLRGFERVVALGGTEYAERVRGAFHGTGLEVLTPTASLSIGKAMRKVKDAIRRGRPFEHSDPVEYS